MNRITKVNIAQDLRLYTSVGIRKVTFYENRVERIFMELPHNTFSMVHAVCLKYQKLSGFLNIFSVDMWKCFALSLVLAVITVSCISDYGLKSHLHESKTYSNISIVTANIIAVLLSVSVNTQPRFPIRLLSFCWLC